MSFLPACVSTHSAHPVLLTTAPVKVSCSYGSDIQTNSISGIVCSLENQSRSWQNLKIRSLRFPDQADVNIVAAEDMQALADAMAVKKSREDHNAAMALSGLILAGALVAVGSTESAKVGEAVMLGGVTAAGARDVKKGYENAQYGPAVYSRDHLLSGALRIPAEMSIRRQIVINHPSQKPKSMEICWVSTKEECSVFSL
jgi:hypothetical protein